MRGRTSSILLTICGAALLAGCGGEGDDPASEVGAQPAPPASAFPEAEGAKLEDLLAQARPADLVVSPAGREFEPGRNRLAFGVFTVNGAQVTDAEVALYLAPGAGGEALGPYPARIESLATDPAFASQTTADDTAAARVAYVTDVRLDRPGEWRIVAMVRDGDELRATRAPSIIAAEREVIPDPGEPAPSVHTPTVEDVGDVSEIDTRDPHDTMHEHDLADVLGERPVVLTFATPLLCQTRVCGPTVDIAEQVKAEHSDDAAFIHMEIYNGNSPDQGLREQVRAYGLRTEPWVFVIDEDGRVAARFEGAVSAAELEAAVERVAG